MAAISTVRKATDEDVKAYELAWVRFYDRHQSNKLICIFPDIIGDIDYSWAGGQLEVNRLKRLWYACASRALKLTPIQVDIRHMPVIAYGHVGYNGY